MPYNQSHRELRSEQLTSAEETLTEFKDVIVKFEEEVDGQHRLLDFTRIPLIILHRIDLVQHCVEEEGVVVKNEEEADGQLRLLDFTRIPLIILRRIDLVQHCVKEEEEDNTDQQLCKQEEPGPLQIKEEFEELEHLQIKVEKELSINKNEDKHVMKQEPDIVVVTPSYEDKYPTEPELNKNQSVSQDSAEAENQDQERSNPEGSGSTRENRAQKTRQQKDRPMTCD
ncbi:hypothetical protein CRENBAI_015032 [Crenichthys baileyi]|uniref:Uncharacterized protein n=1 Tax=Crenichthys baileyi TaxID=28760 RepID=A0AAV9SS10_9TELE